jgi:hypothetical protein
MPDAIERASSAPPAMVASLDSLLASSLPEVSHSFSFHTGSGPNLQFHYGWHVRRWWTSEYDPFVKDPDYNQKKLSPDIQRAIRFRHTIGLALVAVVVECGKKFIKTDSIGRCVRESYTMFTDVRWTDGSKRFERGIITVAYDPRSKEFFHVGFALKAPSTLYEEYLRDGYFAAEIDEESSEHIPEISCPIKTLPDDGSRILRIDECGVDVSDPKNRVVFELYWE